MLARHAVGKRIRRVEVRDRGALRGRRFRRPQRHGKWLVARTDARPVLLFHFGMTGALWWRRRGEPERPHDRIVFGMKPGELRYNDLRKLHGARLASEAGAERVLARLGPDALAISRWRARVHPATPVARVSTQKLHSTMKRVLAAALPTGRVPPRATWLTGRTSVWCPRCQRRGRG